MNYLSYILNQAKYYNTQAVFDDTSGTVHDNIYRRLAQARKHSNQAADIAAKQGKYELAALYRNDSAVFDDAIQDYRRIILRIYEIKALITEGKAKLVEQFKLAKEMKDLLGAIRTEVINRENGQKALKGSKSEVYLNDEELPTQLFIVESDSLKPSQNRDDNQFRDRNRAASRVQVANMANKLSPKRLGDSPEIGAGAPTLAKDGVSIIGGNGRVLAIQAAYQAGDKGDEYRDYLIENAWLWGINPKDVQEMKQPVLIRILQVDVDIKAAAVASNEKASTHISHLSKNIDRRI